MSFCKLRLELQSFLAGFVSLPKVEIPRIEIGIEKRARISHTCVGKRVVRIELYCLVEHLPGVLETPSPQLMDELPAAQIVVVGLNVRARLALDRFLLAL